MANRDFDAKEYTKDSLVQELLLLERHIRDGSVHECGCAWDQHLPMIEGLCSEGIKFAESPEERKFFDDLMHRAREARIKLQYGEEEKVGNPNGKSQTIEGIIHKLEAQELKTTEKYQGWSNWDTWETWLILTNEQRSHRWLEAWSKNFKKKIKRGVFDIEKAMYVVSQYLVPVARGKKRAGIQMETSDDAIDPKQVDRAEIVGALLKMETNNPGGNPHSTKCSFRKEGVKAKSYFDPRSFRTVCPTCPGGQCSSCPPDLKCSTRVIVGCKKGKFAKGRCRIGLEAHTILHA